MTVSYYPELKMWEATGDLVYTSPGAPTNATTVTPDSLSYSLNYGGLSGSLAGGDIAGAMKSNVSTGDLLSIRDQDWGIWNMAMGGSYTGSPSGTTPYHMGGSISGDMGGGSYSSGYWLGDADLVWNTNTFGGALKNGRFLTGLVMGGISTTYGGIMGTYGGGLWRAVASGYGAEDRCFTPTRSRATCTSRTRQLFIPTIMKNLFPGHRYTPSPSTLRAKIRPTCPCTAGRRR